MDLQGHLEHNKANYKRMAVHREGLWTEMLNTEGKIMMLTRLIEEQEQEAAQEAEQKAETDETQAWLCAWGVATHRWLNKWITNYVLLATNLKMKLTPYLNELINSGITLNEKEAKIVEDFLFDNSDYYYPPGYNVPEEVSRDKRSKTLRSGAVVKPRKRCK